MVIPHSVVIAHEAQGLATRLSNLGKGVAVEVDGTQQGEELVPGISFIVEVVDVATANPRFEQLEAVADGAVLHVRRIGVPAGTHQRVICDREDLTSVRRKLRTPSVNFHPDFYAMVARHVSALGE